MNTRELVEFLGFWSGFFLGKIIPTYSRGLNDFDLNQLACISSNELKGFVDNTGDEVEENE